MYLVQQMSRFHCFPACLSSFLHDLQLPLQQNEIVKQLPELFFKGTETEGAFTNSDENLEIVAKKFNIKIQPNPAGEIQIPHGTTLFFFVRWENNPDDNHCLRFNKQENGSTYFMNPNSAKIESIESDVLGSWITKTILIKR